jgi:uncharacterized membrane protein
MTHSSIATSATYIATYDLPLVVLSIVIASVASYTALNLAGRITVTQGSERKLWLAGGASAMGVGIWSMHFIAMLAYQLPIPMSYDIPTVLISMVAAVLASGLALFVVSRQKMEWLQLLLGSIFMGLGIASMHYIGMGAMRVERAPVRSKSGWTLGGERHLCIRSCPLVGIPTSRPEYTDWECAEARQCAHYGECRCWNALYRNGRRQLSATPHE